MTENGFIFEQRFLAGQLAEHVGSCERLNSDTRKLYWIHSGKEHVSSSTPSLSMTIRFELSNNEQDQHQKMPNATWYLSLPKCPKMN